MKLNYSTSRGVIGSVNISAADMLIFTMSVISTTC